MSQKKYILAGFLFSLPFLVANFIVAKRMEPTYSFLGSLGLISSSPFPFVLILVALGLVGALVVAWPLLKRRPDGCRTFFPFNAVFAALLFLGFATVGIALGHEWYRCDVLLTPNCD